MRTKSDGRRRIVRVLKVGDIVGLEALSTDIYDNDAFALTSVKLCRIPKDVIQNLTKHSTRLNAQLMNKWQHLLKESDDWLADLNFGTARQRVCNLILKMRSSDNDEISNLFSRDDMGAMLDLKLETVSREISLLAREGLIEQMDKKGHVYRITNAESLMS